MLVAVPCVACASAPGPVCAACAGRLHPVGAIEVPGVDRAWALMAYGGVARELVHGLKYANRRAALAPLADAAARLVDEPPEVVTWVPAERDHLRRRGFDQGELLARRVGRRLGLPARRLLDRVPGRAQTGLDRAERLTGPALRPRRRARGVVLVVDDVVTTGGSLAAAARALRTAGAPRVLALALAATPAR